MRKLLTLSFLGLLISTSAGCECWDCFMQFENWKNETLFGCGRSNNCAPYAQQYQYAPMGCAGVAGYGGADCAGVVNYGGIADCAGITMEAPCADGNCTTGACGAGGCGPGGCDIAAPANIYAPVPGQMIVPGQGFAPGQVIGPAPGVVPAPTL